MVPKSIAVGDIELAPGGISTQAAGNAKANGSVCFRREEKMT
jgi:hypothetical protein